MKGFYIVTCAVLVAIGVGIGAVAGLDPATSTVASTQRCAPAGTLICITSGDSGRTERVPLGHRLSVELNDSGLVWSGLHQVGLQLLREDGAPTTGRKLFTSLYTAVRTGKTSLEAVAAPKCVPDQACPQFRLLWRTQITVLP